jgi:hypothetical protein
MSKRSNVFWIISVLLIAAAITITWHQASAKVITENSIAFGKQGIFIPGGLSPEIVSLDRLSPGEFRGGPIVFKRPLMVLGFKDSDGRRASIPFALTFVYYQLNQAEQRQWDKGTLNIYYRDVNSSSWNSCSTTPVTGPPDEEGKANITLSCPAPQATIFGLGSTRSEE